MALPLVTFEKAPTDEDKDRTTMILHGHSLESVLKLSGDLPLCPLCICGPSRKGKSFLLGHIIRCLYATEKDIQDWMDWENPGKPLDTTFVWKNGRLPVTEGIWIWNKPFIVTSGGRKVAVIIVDTQGTNDEFTSNRDMASIVGLSLLLSSVTIFNFFTSLQEDILSSLRTYVEYGKIAKEHSNGNSQPFQKLTFLIRDWNDPDSCDFGKEGGNKLLEEIFKIRDNQPENARELRMKIMECFEDMDCFLMPHIGQKALRQNYNGNIAELDPEFAHNMETFINDLIRSQLLCKTLVGSEIRGLEFRDYLSMYVKAFNENTIPSAMSIWEATTLAADNITLGRAVKAYTDALIQCRGNKLYLNPTALAESNEVAKATAKEDVKGLKILGESDVFEAKLSSEISNRFANFKLENDQIRTNNLENVNKEGLASFKQAYTADRKLDKGTFLSTIEISLDGTKAQQTALDNIQSKINLETEKDRKKIRTELVKRFETLMYATQIKNEQNRRAAEKKLDSLIESGFQKFTNDMEAWVTRVQGYSLSTLTKELNAQKRKCLEMFERGNKLGDNAFKTRFKAKLVQRIDTATSTFIEGCKLLEAEKKEKEAQEEREMERQRHDEEQQREREAFERQLAEQQRQLEFFREQAEKTRVEAEQSRQDEQRQIQQLMEQQARMQMQLIDAMNDLDDGCTIM